MTDDGFSANDPLRNERAAREARRRQRDELLLNYAACRARRDDAAAIIDIDGVAGFICRRGDREIIRLHADLALDSQTHALVLRDGLVALFEKQAGVFRRMAQDEFGVTESELRQAERDYHLIAAQRAQARKEVARSAPPEAAPPEPSPEPSPENSSELSDGVSDEVSDEVSEGGGEG